MGQVDPHIKEWQKNFDRQIPIKPKLKRVSLDKFSNLRVEYEFLKLLHDQKRI